MSAAEPLQIPIDLIGDVASAECFIGLHLIRAVVASAPGLAVDIRWHPFEINPELPPEGQDRAAFLEEKYGTPQEAREPRRNRARIQTRLRLRQDRAATQYA